MVRRSTLCVFGSFVGENRSIWVRRGRGTGRGDIVFNGLGEGVIAGIHAELSDKETIPGMMKPAKEKYERRRTLAGSFMSIQAPSISNPV
jgi:hypothetical protein